MVKYVPIRDQRQLSLTWELPPLFSHFKSKARSYVSHRTSYLSHRTSCVSHRTPPHTCRIAPHACRIAPHTCRIAPHLSPHPAIYLASSFCYIPSGFHTATLTCVCADDAYRQAHTCRTSSGTRYAVYLLYWYESTNTDAKRRARLRDRWRRCSRSEVYSVSPPPFF